MSHTEGRIGVPVFLETGQVFDELTHRRAEEIVGRYPVARSALLPLLHLVQSVEGCVSQPGIDFCAEQLDLTAAEVSAVATFYTMYKRRPCGEHLVSVCTNTLCAALGGDAIYSTLSAHLGVGHEETTGEPAEAGAPGTITLEHAECLAACDLAPVLQVDYEYFDEQTPDSALDLVLALQAGGSPTPTRGPALRNFRTAELEIAGIFPDADERVAGPSLAEPTVRGVRDAERTGQHAPPGDDVPIPPLPEK
ncbi:NADH-quinone oxidoreductase subunit NuoE [Nakamurella leprariae]|uniref:NADH-quinone oxidoreductase subunit NuoE n=1 Tax=Nakamurella leprariae TaxID=2803911 RepID=A0A938Y949_9ACTN|nr:NADH-quinone oxidoreductase subunit NuoE [Nakamurella leprariae]MBM9466247.1 NADH-quinone oxidoreductase subunit NuoE [Nakamurella leprariae]